MSGRSRYRSAIRVRLVAWGAATLLGACRSEPIRTTGGGADAADTASVIAAPHPVVLESVPPVPDVVMTGDQRRGQALYNASCWTCHGLYGHGDGPAARGFAAPLPDLGRLATASPAGRILTRIQAARAPSGSDSATPEWHALPAETLRLAVAYLRTMSPSGSPGNAAAGRLLYATYCSQCHGMRGRGDGRLASTYAPRPADLRALRLEGREAQVLASLSEGGARDHRAYMPDWGRVLTDDQRWDLVAYLEVLRAAR